MKSSIYELLGMVKDETDKTNINIYVKYFDRVKKRDDIMLACKENIIYKLDHSNIELNDEVEILEEPKGIPEKLKCGKVYNNLDDRLEYYEMKINEIIDYLEYLESKGE